MSDQQQGSIAVLHPKAGMLRALLLRRPLIALSRVFPGLCLQWQGSSSTLSALLQKARDDIRPTM